MTGTSPLAGNDLKQPAELFYSRLNYGEPERVRTIVESLRGYMAEQIGNDFLIAGVGGILRFAHPGLAQDIDLAAVGLKYTASPASRRDHDFDHVIQFTETVQGYFEGLYRKLISEFGLENREFRLSRGGSGPFQDMDRRYKVGSEKNPSVMLESDLEEFGWWGSKGLRVCFQAIRPIDIQFVFNETPEEWEENQRELREKPTKSRRDISDHFPYAVL